MSPTHALALGGDHVFNALRHGSAKTLDVVVGIDMRLALRQALVEDLDILLAAANCQEHFVDYCVQEFVFGPLQKKVIFFLKRRPPTTVDKRFLDSLRNLAARSQASAIDRAIPRKRG